MSVPSKAHNFIELECATCDVNAGVLLAFPVSAAKRFDGSTTTFSIPLDETAGWRKDLCGNQPVRRVHLTILH